MPLSQVITNKWKVVSYFEIMGVKLLESIDDEIECFKWFEHSKFLENMGIEDGRFRCIVHDNTLKQSKAFVEKDIWGKRDTTILLYFSSSFFQG